MHLKIDSNVVAPALAGNICIQKKEQVRRNKRRKTTSSEEEFFCEKYSTQECKFFKESNVSTILISCGRLYLEHEGTFSHISDFMDCFQQPFNKWDTAQEYDCRNKYCSRSVGNRG